MRRGWLPDRVRLRADQHLGVDPVFYSNGKPIRAAGLARTRSGSFVGARTDDGDRRGGSAWAAETARHDTGARGGDRSRSRGSPAVTGGTGAGSRPPG